MTALLCGYTSDSAIAQYDLGVGQRWRVAALRNMAIGLLRWNSESHIAAAVGSIVLVGAGAYGNPIPS